MSFDISGFAWSTPGQSRRPSALRLFAVLDAWSERSRQRRALRELSDHLLKDLGIDRADAYQEGSKPFWRD